MVNDLVVTSSERCSIKTGDELTLYEATATSGRKVREQKVLQKRVDASVTTGGDTPILQNQSFDESIWPPPKWTASHISGEETGGHTSSP